MTQSDEVALALLVLLAVWLAVRYRRKWRGTGYAHGTSRWASERDLDRAGMFGPKGQILGRTTRRGKLIRVPKYTHLSVFAPTGAGKGVSFVISTLLSYTAGSTVVFDPKGELYMTTAARRRAMGQQVYVLDPFNICTAPGESDCYNPLLEAAIDPLRLVDEARAIAEAIVVRPPEGDKDPHWNSSAVMLFTALIVATMLFMRDDDKTLTTVREMKTDPLLFKEVIKRLQASGGIPARLGNQLARQQESEKEMAGVLSTANTHASFLDSDLVARVLSRNTFSADVLLQPGSTLYIVLPIVQLDAQRNFLRLVVSSLMRHVMRHGVKNGGEVLFLLDECASFAAGLECSNRPSSSDAAKGYGCTRSGRPWRWPRPRSRASPTWWRITATSRSSSGSTRTPRPTW